MKKTLCLFTALIAFLSPVTAGEKPFPAKNPVLKMDIPEKWKTETDAKDGSIAIESPDERIAIHFAPVPVGASLEVFEKILPDMLKDLKDATVVDKAKEHTEDGLTGYTATYAAKIEGKAAMCIFVLFKGDDEHSVLGTIFVGDAETLPKEDAEAMGAFMKSLKGAK